MDIYEVIVELKMAMQLVLKHFEMILHFHILFYFTLFDYYISTI